MRRPVVNRVRNARRRTLKQIRKAYCESWTKGGRLSRRSE